MMSDIEDEVMVKPVNDSKNCKHSPQPIKRDNYFLTFSKLNSSDESNDISALNKSIFSAPDINQDRVEHFRKKISSGDYQIDSNHIAKRILNNR